MHQILSYSFLVKRLEITSVICNLMPESDLLSLGGTGGAFLPHAVSEVKRTT
jgi:hypothetical protein